MIRYTIAIKNKFTGFSIGSVAVTAINKAKALEQCREMLSMQGVNISVVSLSIIGSCNIATGWHN